jgi:hypothetical protein
MSSGDCPCFGGVVHPIDELRTEQLDLVPRTVAGPRNPPPALRLPHL